MLPSFCGDSVLKPTVERSQGGIAEEFVYKDGYTMERQILYSSAFGSP